MHEDASLKRIWELSKKAKGDQLVFRALGISAWQSTQIERYSIECATPLAWISVWQLRWEHSICLTWCCILSGSKGVKREFLLLKKNAHRNTYMILPVCRRQSNINDKSLIPLGSDTQCYTQCGSACHKAEGNCGTAADRYMHHLLKLNSHFTNLLSWEGEGLFWRLYFPCWLLSRHTYPCLSF